MCRTESLNKLCRSCWLAALFLSWCNFPGETKALCKDGLHTCMFTEPWCLPTVISFQRLMWSSLFLHNKWPQFHLITFSPIFHCLTVQTSKLISCFCGLSNSFLTVIATFDYTRYDMFGSYAQQSYLCLFAYTSTTFVRSICRNTSWNSEIHSATGGYLLYHKLY